MIKFVKNLLAFGALFSGSYAFAMKPAPETSPNFGIVLRNTLNRRIQFSWINNQGQSVSKILNAEEGVETAMKNFQAQSKLNFQVYGEWMGYSAVAKEVSTNELVEQWFKLKQNSTDTLEIQITSSYGGVKIELLYAILQEKKPLVQMTATEKTLELFPQLKYYGFDKKFTSSQILSFGKANQIIIPAGRIIGGETKAGDIYRYILDVGKNYTMDDIKTAYKKKSFEFHPDKLQGNTELATDAFRLITHAKDELLKALEEKELGGDWVDLQPAWQPDSPRKQPQAQESSERAVVVAAEEEL